MKKKKSNQKINISEKELMRDVVNLHIPEEKQHIPFVEVEDLPYSEKEKEYIRKQNEQWKKQNDRNE